MFRRDKINLSGRINELTVRWGFTVPESRERVNLFYKSTTDFYHALYRGNCG